MRWMLVGLIALLIGTDFTGINPGLGPGLSVKNAMLYLAVMVLAFRMALTGGFRLRMPGMHLAWVAWVGYALLTWLAVSLVLKYHTYEPLASAMALKSELIDCALYCFVAFYIVQTEDDFRFVLHALVGVVGISSVLTLTDLVGITGLGMKVGESGAEVTLTGPIAAKYSSATQSQRDALGKPLTGDRNAGTRDSGVVFQQFQGGAITAKNGEASTPAYIILGTIREAWNVPRGPDGTPAVTGTNGSAGPLGLPTSDVNTVGDLQVSTFEHGKIEFNPTTGQVAVTVNDKVVPSGL